MVKKTLAILVWITTLTVAVHFVFSPFYENSVDTGRVWDYVNWLMAFGVAVSLVAHLLRKIEMDSEGLDSSINREYLEINLAFYASLFLALWFFWNWFDNIFATEGQSATRLVLWSFVNPLFVVVTGATGLHLWRSASRYRY